MEIKNDAGGWGGGQFKEIQISDLGDRERETAPSRCVCERGILNDSEERKRGMQQRNPAVSRGGDAG